MSTSSPLSHNYYGLVTVSHGELCDTSKLMINNSNIYKSDCSYNSADSYVYRLPVLYINFLKGSKYPVVIKIFERFL